MERTSLCVVCDFYEIAPVSLSVDPACRSSRDVDALCSVHRARATEGYCVLCARRKPWVSPWPESRIGSCEPCFRERFDGPPPAAAPAWETPGAPARSTSSTDPRC